MNMKTKYNNNSSLRGEKNDTIIINAIFACHVRRLESD